MLALSVHMRPTCAERGESATLRWVRAKCHASTSSKWIERMWDSLRISHVRIICSRFQIWIKKTGQVKSKALNWNSVEFVSNFNYVDHFFSVKWQVGSWLLSWPQCGRVLDMVHVIIMVNLWMAGKCASIKCTCHLINLVQVSYIMRLINGQKHWLWSTDPITYVMPVIITHLLCDLCQWGRGLSCMAESKTASVWPRTLPLSPPTTAFKMKMTSFYLPLLK